MAGLVFLILLLYVIGKNQNLFGSNFRFMVHFDNVHGLMRGNNICFGGIDAGIVKEIQVINDTTIEVRMLVKTKVRAFILKNEVVFIGTDNLIGNKILNIGTSGRRCRWCKKATCWQRSLRECLRHAAGAECH